MHSFRAILELRKHVGALYKRQRLAGSVMGPRAATQGAHTHHPSHPTVKVPLSLPCRTDPRGSYPPKQCGAEMVPQQSRLVTPSAPIWARWLTGGECGGLTSVAGRATFSSARPTCQDSHPGDENPLPHQAPPRQTLPLLPEVALLG